ncbi:hypothetical protein FR943_16380 [Mycobacterium sp. TNTM28]|uniref:Uncharacterized protein n=1 Tax=[Mycobacterium] fortunisiensis TaxID=2600579 RepID=A0ABS6KPC6_9MYCO|nr:hypothetical protein [[Mycobacterium] fortunisiensis]MBU9765418.1 hypothetical protein [[Mycobacterium] fortunisiensis]
MRAIQICAVAAAVSVAAAAIGTVVGPAAAWARGEQTGMCTMLLDGDSLDCDWGASGNQVWLSIENDTEHDIRCVAEATFEIMWDDASADVRKGDTAKLVLQRDPEDTEWYKVTCSTQGGKVEDSRSFSVWSD